MGKIKALYHDFDPFKCAVVREAIKAGGQVLLGCSASGRSIDSRWDKEPRPSQAMRCFLKTLVYRVEHGLVYGQSRLLGSPRRIHMTEEHLGKVGRSGEPLCQQGIFRASLPDKFSPSMVAVPQTYESNPSRSCGDIRLSKATYYSGRDQWGLAFHTHDSDVHPQPCPPSPVYGTRPCSLLRKTWHETAFSLRAVYRTEYTLFPYREDTTYYA
jgi:hypothetical protein